MALHSAYAVKSPQGSFVYDCGMSVETDDPQIPDRDGMSQANEYANLGRPVEVTRADVEQIVDRLDEKVDPGIKKPLWL